VYVITMKNKHECQKGSSEGAATPRPRQAKGIANVVCLTVGINDSLDISFQFLPHDATQSAVTRQ